MPAVPAAVVDPLTRRSKKKVEVNQNSNATTCTESKFEKTLEILYSIYFRMQKLLTPIVIYKKLIKAPQFQERS